MTRIKLCGLSRPCDIEAANALQPEYIGFVFAPKSRRYVTPERAADLRRLLAPGIQAVGVFVDEAPETAAQLLDSGVIDMAQLHGEEDEGYIRRLKRLTDRPIIKAFRVENEACMAEAEHSPADLVLLDSGAGTGKAFDWRFIQKLHRPYFLAGGLDACNVREAVRLLHPFAVDVSSGIETDGRKDEKKMAAFVAAVRKGDGR
ncbi:MAG: phosphoribosylanthranilate isomerase [Aristaeellaceae bacterium]